jgi:hemerythrin-like domain-containing protein
MQARGPLMIEHRLIERMIKVVKKILNQVEFRKQVDPVMIDTVVDFIRIYADRVHHGKEENILFREMNKLSLSANDKRIMQELIEEHVIGRRTTQAVVEANDRYRNGDASALADISANLAKLVEFYPEHIQKEDKVFFPVIRNYLSDEEDQSMLVEFWEFDRKMIHEKYLSIVKALEND